MLNVFMPTLEERIKEIESVDDSNLMMGYRFLTRLPRRRKRASSAKVKKPHVKKLAAKKRGAGRKKH
jgi:hypothetical protein